MKKKTVTAVACCVAVVIVCALIGFIASKGAKDGYASETLSNPTMSQGLSASEKITDATVTQYVETPHYEYASFNGTAFLGNSRFVSLKDYNLAPNVYPVVGLDVRTVFTKYVTNSNVVVIDELDGREFDKVILMFGDNECGWPNRDYFIDKYKQVIDAVKKKQPDAQIYLHAIIPVSAETSDRNECDCNNITIHELNVRIRQLADDCDVNYIDVPSCLLDYEGNLISEASKDGVHLNKKYSTLWMAYLEQFMFK